MKLLITFTVLVAAASAALKGYTLPTPSGTGLITGTTTGGISVQSTTTGYSAGVESSTPLDQAAVSGGFVSSTPGHLGGFESSTVSGIVSEYGSNEETGVSFGEGGLTTGISSESGQSISTGTGLTSEQVNSETPCPEGQIRHLDGSCVVPEISRKVFVVSVPKQTPQLTESVPNIPPPRVDHNILFVRLPEGGTGPDPIVVPPPRQNNIVYVLSKKSEGAQRVIEVPAPPPSEPEIYFVNYDDGENPTLPGGLDLLTALGSASETSGQILGAGNVFGGDFETDIDFTASGSTDGTYSDGISEVSGSFQSISDGIQITDDTTSAGSQTGASQFTVTTDGNTQPSEDSTLSGLYETP